MVAFAAGELQFAAQNRRVAVRVPQESLAALGISAGGQDAAQTPQLALTASKRDNVPSTGVFVSDRKYRQRGYQDSGEERQKPSSEKSVKKDTFGPRPVHMPGTHTVSRCAQCGTLLPAGIEPTAKCPKCDFELHSCRQCTYFDTSSRFECSQSIPERIPRKDERNQCTFYSMRVRVEKETSTPSAAKPIDARQAFENLFKK